LQEDVKNFGYYHVPEMNLNDSPSYGPMLVIEVDGQKVEAGRIRLNHSMLVALIGDFGQLAGGKQLLNYTEEQRAQVGFSSVFCVTVAACVYVLC
jgi:hypothetical protein